jgi:hypothetical protein
MSIVSEKQDKSTAKYLVKELPYLSDERGPVREKYGEGMGCEGCVLDGDVVYGCEGEQFLSSRFDAGR